MYPIIFISTHLFLFDCTYPVEEFVKKRFREDLLDTKLKEISKERESLSTQLGERKGELGEFKIFKVRKSALTKAREEFIDKYNELIREGNASGLLKRELLRSRVKKLVVYKDHILIDGEIKVSTIELGNTPHRKTAP